jgi:hypothetical protein
MEVKMRCWLWITFWNNRKTRVDGVWNGEVFQFKLPKTKSKRGLKRIQPWVQNQSEEVLTIQPGECVLKPPAT